MMYFINFRIICSVLFLYIYSSWRILSLVSNRKCRFLALLSSLTSVNVFFWFLWFWTLAWVKLCRSRYFSRYKRCRWLCAPPQRIIVLSLLPAHCYQLMPNPMIYSVNNWNNDDYNSLWFAENLVHDKTPKKSILGSSSQIIWYQGKSSMTSAPWIITQYTKAPTFSTFFLYGCPCASVIFGHNAIFFPLVFYSFSHPLLISVNS